MKQLTRMQVSSLAQKICNDLNSEINRRNSLVKNSEEYKNFFETNQYCIDLTKIQNLCLSTNSSPYYFDQIRNLIRNKEFESKLISTIISFSDIENEIILKTIDCDDLNEIINSIKNEFSKSFNTNE